MEGSTKMTSKTNRVIFAITAYTVILLGLSRTAVAQPLVWTDPEPLNNNAATDVGADHRPRVTTDGSGNWVAVWDSFDDLGGTIGADSDILVARSTDNGTTWTDPEPLNNNATTDSGSDADPQVTTDGAGNWVAEWNTNDTLGGTVGTDSDILVARSTDNGSTWSDPQTLNNNATTDLGSDFHPQLTTDAGGNWVAVWESNEDLCPPGDTCPPDPTIGTDYDILVARSTDNGLNWTDPAPLNTNAATDTGGDANVQLTTDGAGNWLAVYGSTDSLGGAIGTDSDVLVAHSLDNGLTWTDPEPLNNNAATDMRDDIQPQLTTDGAGNWLALWASNLDPVDVDILVARSTDNGTTWSDPLQINNNGGTDPVSGFPPKVTTDGSGSWVGAWTSRDSLGGTIGTDHDILMAVSTDNGLTWTAPAPLNNNAATDAGLEGQPDLTTDGMGKWVAAWYSEDTLGGTIGIDRDILVVRSPLDGQAIPTLSEWGLVAMALVMLTAGTVVCSRSARRTTTVALLGLLVAFDAANVYGDVVIETVTIGHPGNPGEDAGENEPGGSGPDRVCGAVNYTYEIGKFEVTAGQYVEFLNAVAATDTYGLYNPNMDADPKGCQITQNGVSGSFTYDFSGGVDEAPGSTAADWENRPVSDVSWGDAARFCNWLHNGQPGIDVPVPQDTNSTEDGSYFLNGVTDNDGLLAVTREPDATWVIPSEDEWYKAAYYDGELGLYHDFPTGTDDIPSGILSNPAPDPGNNANCDPGGDQYTIGSPYWRTIFGDFENSVSPHGTFDMGGNINEWTEALVSSAVHPDGLFRQVRGGSYFQLCSKLHAAQRTGFDADPQFGFNILGFRVARVSGQAPVPAASEWNLIVMALLVLTAGTLVYAWRKPVRA